MVAHQQHTSVTIQGAQMTRSGGHCPNTLTIPWNLAKPVKTCHGIICTSTPHCSETNGVAQREVRRRKEGTSAVLLHPSLDLKWWAYSMECYCNLRNVQDLLSDGKTPYERRFGMPFNGPVIPFGAMVEYHPISAKDLSRLHNPCSKAQCKRSVDAKKVQFLKFSIADGTAKLFGRDHGVRESTPWWEQLARSEDFREELQRNSERSQPTETKAEARNDSWSMEGDFNVPNIETFPVPRKYVDVNGTTHANLDVLQESRLDDHGSVDVDRNLSGSWTRFTKVTLLNEKPAKGYTWSGAAAHKDSSNYQT